MRHVLHPSGCTTWRAATFECAQNQNCLNLAETLSALASTGPNSAGVLAHTRCALPKSHPTDIATKLETATGCAGEASNCLYSLSSLSNTSLTRRSMKTERFAEVSNVCGDNFSPASRQTTSSAPTSARHRAEERTQATISHEATKAQAVLRMMPESALSVEPPPIRLTTMCVTTVVPLARSAERLSTDLRAAPDWNAGKAVERRPDCAHRWPFVPAAWMKSPCSPIVSSPPNKSKTWRPRSQHAASLMVPPTARLPMRRTL